MRIVIDGRYINDAFPGIGRYTYNLAFALAKNFEAGCLVVLVNSRLPNRRYDLNRLASLPAVEIADCRVDRFLPAELVGLAPSVRRLHPDLFHSPFFLRPYPLSSPCVFTIYDLLPFQFPKQFSLTERNVFRIGMYLAVRKAAAILTISDLTARALSRTWPTLKDRCFVTPLAPDPVFRPLSQEEKRQHACRLGMDGTRYVFHVSNGMRHKNIELLLSAWKRLVQGGSAEGIKLVLAGDYGRRRRRLVELAGQLEISDSVLFAGRVDDRALVALYNCSDFFVFPSSVEGFGLPVIEAMACGTPVLTTDSVGLASKSARAALTVPAGSLDPLVAALGRLLKDEDLRHTLSAAGLAHARECTWEATARATLRVYQKILGASDQS